MVMLVNSSIVQQTFYSPEYAFQYVREKIDFSFSQLNIVQWLIQITVNANIFVVIFKKTGKYWN